MRFKIYSASGMPIAESDTWQNASDIACARIKDWPSEIFAYVHDTAPGMVYPFVRYSRSGSMLCAWIGNPFKTLRQCIENDDGGGYHVETYGGGKYTSIAWFADSASAYRERLRMISAGAWFGMPPRVTKG